MSAKATRLSMFLVAVLMVLGIFTGCSASNPSTSAAASAAATSSQAAAATATPAASAPAASAAAADGIQPGTLPISKDKITLKAFWPAPANVLKLVTDFNQCAVYPVLEQKTNIHIDWQHGTAEQYNLMINSGDLADIIFAPDSTYKYPGGGEKAVADGAYLKLNDYLDKYCMWYPKIINSTPEFKRDACTDDGTIWGFAMVETHVQGAWMGMTLRQDMLDKLGLSTPVTYDDWHTMLTKMKDDLKIQAPLTLPKTLFAWTDNFIAGYGVGQAFYQVDKKVQFGPLQPGFKQFITMMAQWYKEGLIDKDFATRDDASLAQLRSTGQSGAWFDGFWVLNYNKGLAKDKDVYRQVGVQDPVVAAGDVCHLRQTNYNVRDEWTSVSAKSAHPIEAVRWLDNLYSDDSHQLLNYGVGDQAYVQKDGKWTPTDLITKNPDGLNIAEAEFRYVMHDGPMQREISRDDVSWTPDELACEGIWDKSDSANVLPMTSLTADEATENSNIMNDITTFVNESCTKFVMGVDSMDNFDKFVAQIKTMNIDRAIAIQQAALDRYYQRK